MAITFKFEIHLRTALELISSQILTFKEIQIQVLDAAGAFFDMLRSVVIQQHDILAFFYMLRLVIFSREFNNCENCEKI